MKLITESGIAGRQFKIEITKLEDKYLKLKNSALFLHFLKNRVKLVKEICKENASEFK